MQMKRLTECSRYLDLEINVTQIVNQLDDLKKKLTHYADLYLTRNHNPLCAIEESISNLHKIKEELKKLDVSFCPELLEEKVS